MNGYRRRAGRILGAFFSRGSSGDVQVRGQQGVAAGDRRLSVARASSAPRRRVACRRAAEGDPRKRVYRSPGRSGDRRLSRHATAKVVPPLPVLPFFPTYPSFACFSFFFLFAAPVFVSCFPSNNPLSVSSGQSGLLLLAACGACFFF